MEPMAEIAVGVPGAMSGGEPQAAAGEDPGLQLPRWQINGAGRMRVNDHFDVGLVLEQARDQGSRKLSADQPLVDGGDAYGYGVSVMGSTALGDQGMHIAFTGELLSYSIPYVEYRTCIDCVGLPPITTVTRDRVNVGVMSLGIIPSWRTGSWTVFGGLSARNQPTVERSGIESPVDTTDDVTGGQLNFMVSAGAELSLAGGLRALAMVYKPVGGMPVDYPATFALGLSWAFGEVKKAPPVMPAAYEAPAPVAAPAPPSVERLAPSDER